MRVRTKLCGIRNARDLRVAVEAGADAVGFICGVTHRSEDALTEAEARALSQMVPPFVSTVLVTHVEQPEEIVRLAHEIDADAIQVHGLVDDDVVRAVVSGSRRRPVIRAVHVTSAQALESARTAAKVCDAILLDSRTEDRLGGTGLTHDWSISAQIVQELSPHIPVILAGGLTSANVTEAIRRVQPYGVDVNTGVDDLQGDKSPQRSQAFVAAVLAADDSTSTEFDRDSGQHERARKQRRAGEPFAKRDRAHH